MSFKTSLIMGYLSFRTYQDEGILSAIRMSTLAFWYTWTGNYNVEETDE